MLAVYLIAVVLSRSMELSNGNIQTISINPPTSGAVLNPLNAAYNSYVNGYGSALPYGRGPSPYGSVLPYGSGFSPYGSALPPYGSAISPYGYTQSPYGYAQSPYGSPSPYNTQQLPTANDPYLPEQLSHSGYFPNGFNRAYGAYPGNGDGDYPSLLSNYNYKSKYASPYAVGKEFGAGTQVGYPGTPGSYRVRLTGALTAESTGPETHGVYASPLSLSGVHAAGKKKK